MEYTQLYFKDSEADTDLVEKLYAETADRLKNKEISLKDIADDLVIETEYLAAHAGESKEIDAVLIDHLRCALSKTLLERQGVLQKTFVKLLPFPEPVPFTQLGHSMVGKLFALAGMVSQIESSKPVATAVLFQCEKCGAEIECRLKAGGIFEKPKKCAEGCPSKSFFLQKDSPHNVFTDHQRVKLHEICLVEEGTRRKPGVVHCILQRSLVNTLLPGDAVLVLGVGIAEETETEQYTLAVEVNNISFLKQRDTFQESRKYVPDEVESIKALSHTPSLLPDLAQAVFPGILGHTRVKEGLILSLVGGSAAGGPTRRKEVHTLVVGDPGMGKSKMMLAASGVLPRSHYVCGTTSTAGGLGVSVHSKGSGEYVLEAGALVLSDLGHCFIDELDKLENPSVLFEAMEREQISIAKAGLVCTMPCRASVIAAANPAHGRYIPEKSLPENLGFSEVFLTRFDLIFLLIDTPAASSEEHSLSSHILALHAPKEEPSQPSMSFELARKYIQYARDHVHPVLSPGAKSLISAFYTEMKAKGAYGGREPVYACTPRLISSVIRLAEARAKLSLRSLAITSDVEYAIDLCTLEHSLQARVSPPHKRGASSSPVHAQFLSLLRSSGEKVFSRKELLSAAHTVCLSEEKSLCLIDQLNMQGCLLQVGSAQYRVVDKEINY
ncbi:DNA helicase MCM8 [Nematocida sp. AWRm77]|nr:DNA helicase MCM8 [Nematocida sp. AWRm77]